MTRFNKTEFMEALKMKLPKATIVDSSGCDKTEVIRYLKRENAKHSHMGGQTHGKLR